MTKPKPTNPSPPARGSKASSESAEEPTLGAKDHYHREKARRARHTPVDSEALKSAKREYEAMLEANAVKGRGGRPKKNAKKTTTEATSDEDPADAE